MSISELRSLSYNEAKLQKERYFRLFSGNNVLTSKELEHLSNKFKISVSYADQLTHRFNMKQIYFAEEITERANCLFRIASVCVSKYKHSEIEKALFKQNGRPILLVLNKMFKSTK